VRGTSTVNYFTVPPVFPLAFHMRIAVRLAVFGKDSLRADSLLELRNEAIPLRRVGHLRYPVWLFSAVNRSRRICSIEDEDYDTAAVDTLVFLNSLYPPELSAHPTSGQARQKRRDSLGGFFFEAQD
jgi:hypothetical protein